MAKPKRPKIDDEEQRRKNLKHVLYIAAAIVIVASFTIWFWLSPNF